MHHAKIQTVYVPHESTGASIRITGDDATSLSFTVGIVPTEIRAVATNNDLLLIGVKGHASVDTLQCASADDARRFADEILDYVDSLNRFLNSSKS